MTVTGQHIRLGILGGTFDPPQNGHLAVAHSVLAHLHLDHVLFVPAGNPWQKNVITDAQQRLDMVQLALDGHEDFSVSSIDITRSGPTYTIDTLRDLRKHYPQSELFFIMGDDAFAGISTWKDFDQLGQFATLVVVSRQGIRPEVPTNLSASVNLLEIPTLPISSTQCRELISAGQRLDGLVPPRVAEYIESHNLYRRSE